MRVIWRARGRDRPGGSTRESTDSVPASGIIRSMRSIKLVDGNDKSTSTLGIASAALGRRGLPPKSRFWEAEEAPSGRQPYKDSAYPSPPPTI
ncbi:hypothetical protein BS47DRAFT_1393181 [Hydnum rufescens UP504]|uniref:Uncharacterized protein n=1 Tax=Hydnum rufescens UP504 TaxID=1448309 RepID=A0A9P6AYC2_9AGAM|nr:hypothetical protein BS47DRAFT_1393181 [Hydnum rufescens UP504]